MSCSALQMGKWRRNWYSTRTSCLEGECHFFFKIFCRSWALPPRCHGGQRWSVQREKKRPSAVSRLSVCESVCVGASDSDRKVDVTR